VNFCDEFARVTMDIISKVIRTKIIIFIELVSRSSFHQKSYPMKMQPKVPLQIQRCDSNSPYHPLAYPRILTKNTVCIMEGSIAAHSIRIFNQIYLSIWRN